jgi:phosphatidylglycerol:prolipoprotein diacylglycerol transferase
VERQLAWYTTLWLLAFAGLFGYFTVRYVVLKLPVLTPQVVGGLKLTPYGPLVATGVLFGIHLTRQWCQRFALDWLTLRDGLLWIVGFGFLVAHVGSIWAYDPADALHLQKYLNFRTGFASFGGFLGGVVATVLYCQKRRLPIRPYIDCLLYGFVGGWLFGRLGCFAVHDHPGHVTDFPAAVMIRGVLRHDLGLYELVFTIGLFAYLTWAIRRGKPYNGFVVAVTAPSYARMRFGLDFLRAGETTYGGLTPAQWACIPLLAIGLHAMRRKRHEGEAGIAPLL